MYLIKKKVLRFILQEIAQVGCLHFCTELNIKIIPKTRSGIFSICAQKQSLDYQQYLIVQASFSGLFLISGMHLFYTVTRKATLQVAGVVKHFIFIPVFNDNFHFSVFNQICTCR